MPEALIIDALRTPIGALGGGLAAVRPDDLAALVMRTILERNKIDPASLEEVIFGCANQAGEDNRNVARMAALLAGIPVSVPGITVNRLCASGLAAVNIAARAIRNGDGEIYLAGGVESMSRAPYFAAQSRKRLSLRQPDRLRHGPRLALPQPQMKETYVTDAMGETAENIAGQRPHLTREKQDQFAARSHQNAIAAIDNGKFAEEIIPVSVPQRKGDPILVRTDERPRRDTSVESLAKLKPAFKKKAELLPPEIRLG